MGTRGLTLGAALAALSFAGAAAAQEAAPTAVDQTLAPYASARDSVRLADGRMIHLVCMGQGSPVVILTAGAGDWSITWSKVQPAVAAKTRVCAWDRPGFGFSGFSPKAPTVDNATTDLEAALAGGGIAGPYVVVGHSLGGYESVLLKDRQPANVVGMVLVDPSIPDQAARMDRAAPAILQWMRDHPSPFTALLQKCAAGLRAGTIRHGGPDPDGCLHPQWPAIYPPELRAAFEKQEADAAPEAIASTLDTMVYFGSPSLLEQDSKLVIKPDRNYGSMPLVVLTAGVFEGPPDFSDAAKAGVPAQRAEWQSGHDAYAALSTRGVNRTVAGSPHDIQHVKPQAVIDAIDEVVDAARRQTR